MMTKSFEQQLATAVMAAANKTELSVNKKDPAPGAITTTSASTSTSSCSLSSLRDGETVHSRDITDEVVVAAAMVQSVSAAMQVGGAVQEVPTTTFSSQPPEAQAPHPPQHHQRVGRWTLDEKILFLYGLKKFGKGRWKKMSVFLPDRSLVQIKSHGQKVLKRLSEGENVFRRLEENVARLAVLLFKLEIPFEPEVLRCSTNNNNSFPAVSPANKKPKPNRRKQRRTKEEPVVDGREHIIAASALCQLAAPSSPQGK